MQPTIVKSTQQKYAGLKIVLRSSLSSANDISKIALLWQQMAQLNFNNRIGQERYVLITGDFSERLEQAHYYALFAVSDFNNLPEGVVTFEAPEGRIAKFVHIGGPQNIHNTALYILKEWLPQSKEVLLENLEFIIYPANYDRTSPTAQSEYCIFLK